MRNRIVPVWAAALMTVALSGSASAVSITADYSLLGTVYQDGSGQLHDTFAPGYTDVTGLFKTNVSTAISYWQNAILLPWSTTVTFTLFDLTGAGAVGDNLITSTDANGRPTSSNLRVDDGSIQFFLDPTPADNSEYTMGSTDAALGGGTVNVGRLGNALAGPASGKWDLLSLLLHELEHGLGFSASLPRFQNVTTATNMTIPTALSLLPSTFDIPLDGTHVDGVASGGLFNDTSIALPGFTDGQRALLTAADILAICNVEGCASNQYNTNPSAAVPEPGTLLMLSLAAPLLIGLSRRRNRNKA
ncbi:PEP-CTERM sorting domain-containing protein [Paludibaculum fermentans]|uniref:PEP-CTERM sorting domain-containing protein n=1 Tax=Paludibaculum fermentans TaxID=1473598 RepID=UPI003EBB809D